MLVSGNASVYSLISKRDANEGETETKRKRTVEEGKERERERVNEESCELIVSARLIHEASTYSFRVVLSYNNSQNHVSRVSELARPRAQTSSVPACNC